MADGILITNYDVSQIFLGCNFYETAEYTNSTGDTVTIPIGRLMGRVLDTDKILPQAAASTDGSEMPIGVAARQYVVPDGTTITMDIVTGGDVNENMVVLASGNAMTTVVRTVSTGGGTIRDLIRRNTTINMYASTEHSRYDNPQS